MSEPGTRLRHAARQRVAPAAGDRPLVNLENVEPGAGRISDADRSAETTQGIRAEPGDVLFAKLRPYLAKSALVTEPLDVSSEFLVMTPQPDLDNRFLLYLTLSKPWLEYAVESSYGTKMPRTSWESLAEFRLPRVAHKQQRRIADFLDDQVARIDNILAAREQQIAALERLRAELLPGLLGDVTKAWSGRDAASIRAELRPSWRVSEMGHLLAQLTNGFVGPTRDILVDDGVRYIQSLHVKNGIIDFERRPYFVRPEWHHERPRINLRANDVLIVQTGDIGQVALVPEGFGEASCHALLIARVNEAVVIPEYFAEYLRSSLGRQELLARATGALHPHLEYGIKEAPIVLPPLADQVRLIRELRHQDESRAQAFETAVELTSKLAELKRSLITAAVSGELDVSSADGSQIPVGATTDVPAGTPAQPTEVPV